MPLMWNDSVARQVGWPSQITVSSPIISIGRDDSNAPCGSDVAPARR